MEILAIPMEKNDSGAKTIGGYLRALLKELWQEGVCRGKTRDSGVKVNE